MNPKGSQISFRIFSLGVDDAGGLVTQAVCEDNKSERAKSVWVVLEEAPADYVIDPDRNAFEVIIERSDSQCR